MRVLGRALSWVLVVGLLAVVVGGIVAVRSGYGVYVVRSGSMVPAFAQGDAVVIGPVVGTVAVGQVITFQHSNRSDDLVTHRVTEITPAGLIHTKGDANPSADVWDIRPEQVQGVQRLVLPRLGYAVVFLRNPRGLAAVLLLALALYLFVRGTVMASRSAGALVRAHGRHSSLAPTATAPGQPQPAGASGAIADDSLAWTWATPPPGFGRLAQCQYPCVVLDDGDRLPGRVLAWQTSDVGMRALVRFSRTSDVGTSRTDEAWFAHSRLEPATF